MSTYNDIGISSALDLPRIKKLLCIGVFASLLHLAGDLILGWGVQDETQSGLLAMFSAYTSTSDGGILAAALTGLVGMTLEGLSMFGIYRLIASKSPKCAHSYRSGILGYLMFGACGFHEPVCAMVFLMKHNVGTELILQYSSYFILPVQVLFWIFFVVLQAAQIVAFAKGYTPCPKYAWVFCMPIGMAVAMIFSLCGNNPFCNAIGCAWIAIGSLYMFTGLLVTVAGSTDHASADNA